MRHVQDGFVYAAFFPLLNIIIKLIKIYFNKKIFIKFSKNYFNFSKKNKAKICFLKVKMLWIDLYPVRKKMFTEAKNYVAARGLAEGTVPK